MSTGEQAARRLEWAVAALLEAVEQLPDGPALRQHPAAGEWSAMETLAHVTELMPFWAERARAVADGQFEGRSYDRSPDELARRAQAVTTVAGVTRALMLDRLRESAARAGDVLRAIPDAGWVRVAGWGPQREPQTVTRLVDDRLIAHVETHTDQVRAAAGRL